MKKAEFIKRYGEDAYEVELQQTRDWRRTHPEEKSENNRLWRLDHPEEVKVNHHKAYSKGGKYYDHRFKYDSTGIRHERKLVRGKHSRRWTPYKKIIDPEGLTQIHHQWIPKTADYRGVALVEKDQHQHGFIDIIQILEGEITLLTEEEIKNKS